MKIPNLKKILKPSWAHNPGEAVNHEGWHKQDIWRQGTIPRDRKILEKLGIKKNEKVLVIAGYYGDWASALKKNGARVDFSDVSKSIVNYVKNKVKIKFWEYICSGYELIPKKSKEYDWTFTYEACGGGQGLSIAYLRSLLNNRGGILVLFYNKENPKSMGGKLKRYPKIVKNLAKAYGCKYIIEKKKIISDRKNQPIKLQEFYIYKIITNNSARKKAEFDIKFLNEIKNKIIVKNNKDSIKRLNILSNAVDNEFIKGIKFIKPKLK